MAQQKVYNMIYHNGVNYLAREIADLECEGQILTVADEQLAEVLRLPDGSFDKLDGDIFGYAPASDLSRKSDKTLFKMFA